MDYTESIKNAKNFIDLHLYDNLTADGIADYVGYSVFHFSRVFKEYTGTSLMRYVREKRLEIAEKEIVSGKSTADVAQKCGFETSSGFSRAYQKQFGERPTRRMHA